MAFTKSTIQLTSSLSFSTAGYGSFSLPVAGSITLANGTTAGKANCGFLDDFSVSSGTPKTYDLQGGGLFQKDGTAFNPTALKEILVLNRDPTNTLTVGGGTNGVVSWSVPVLPGGELLITAPGAGIPVTASTADILQITGSAASVLGTVKLVGIQ